METNNIRNNSQPLNQPSEIDDDNNLPKKRHKQRIEHRRKPPDCNFYSCKSCNINWKPRPKVEQEKYAKVREKRNYKKSNKFCNLSCETCERKMEAIEEANRWYNMKHQQNAPKPKEERFKNASPEEIIKESDMNDFTELQQTKDEESFWRSLLTAAGENQHLYDELKLQLPEIVEKWSTTDSTARSRLVREHINDKTPASPDLIKAIADYSETNFIIYTGGDWKTIKATPSSNENLILKHAHNRDELDIFSPLKLNYETEAFQLTKLRSAIKDLLGMNNQREEEVIEPREFIFLVWNCRKMRSQIKADILNDIAITRDADFILLQETHLSSEENFKMRNFKIFRSDTETHTKGTAILVNKRVNAQSMVMQRDLEGRAIKVRVEDTNTNIAYTISSLYQEPSAEEQIINPLFFASDVVGGDCNDHLTGLDTYHKYHYKNLILIDEFHCPLSFSDHRILIMKTTMRLKTKDISTTITKIDKRTADHNLTELTQFNSEQEGQLSLTNPRCTWNIENPRLMHIDLNVDYITMERQRIRETKENTTNKQQQIAYLTNKMNLTKNDWQMLNNNLNLKKKAGIYNKNNDFPQILSGFKKHFMHNENEPTRQAPEAVIYKLLEQTIIQTRRNPGEKQFTPKSTARDYYGFRQRDIINNWQNNSSADIIERIVAIWNGKHKINGIDMFFHNTSNILLFKKTAEAQSWDKLRPIAIFPAWLMCVEKVVSKTINKDIKEVLSTHQYGFTENRDINTAKLKAAQTAQDNNYRFTTLLDLSKAYDCVNLNKLIDIIKQKPLPSQTKQYLISLLNMYQQIKLNIHDSTIQPNRGLPQGAPTSPTFFNLYIDEILVTANTNHNQTVRIAAYADDIVVQTTTIQEAQEILQQLSIALKNKELTLNVAKTILISELENATLELEGQTIESVKYSRYLGQIIDFNARAATTINSKEYGKLLAVMQNNKNISRIGLVRLFQIYLRAKFNHMIPLIIQSDKLEETWKILKKILFKYTLSYSTMPLESRNLLKIGFYNIIIRPLIKLTHRIKAENDELLLAFVNQSIKKAAAYWLEAEPNLPENIQEAILEVTQTEELQLQNPELWDKEIRKMAINRLLNYNTNLEILATTEKLTYPNIILVTSMANIHTIQDAIIGMWKKPNTRNARQKTIHKTIHKMLIIHNLSEGNYVYDVELIDSENLYATAEQFALLETDIKVKTRKVEKLITQEAETISNRIISSNIQPNNANNFTRENTKIQELLEIQQQTTTNMIQKTKNQLKATEIAIEYLLREKTTIKQTNQRTITDYLNN